MGSRLAVPRSTTSGSRRRCASIICTNGNGAIHHRDVLPGPQRGCDLQPLHAAEGTPPAQLTPFPTGAGPAGAPRRPAPGVTFGDRGHAPGGRPVGDTPRFFRVGGVDQLPRRLQGLAHLQAATSLRRQSRQLEPGQPQARQSQGRHAQAERPEARGLPSHRLPARQAGSAVTALSPAGTPMSVHRPRL
jgi:hypothetical protein